MLMRQRKASYCPFFSTKAPGLVVSIGYGRVRPAKNQGGPASPLHCSRSSFNEINFLGAEGPLRTIEDGAPSALVRTGPGGPPFRNLLKRRRPPTSHFRRDKTTPLFFRIAELEIQRLHPRQCRGVYNTLNRGLSKNGKAGQKRMNYGLSKASRLTDTSFDIPCLSMVTP
jgi:hypothetical protein